MLLGFKRRFAPFVEEGSKTHTIRAKRKIAPKVGETCHCYTGLRQKGARLLGRWECVRVEDIRIEIPRPWAHSPARIWIGTEELSVDEANTLAWRDGFRSRGHSRALSEMIEYWLDLHPKSAVMVFAGDIIHWKYSKRNRSAPIRKPRAA